MSNISGRKKRKAQQFEVSEGIDLVVVLTDYIHHHLMQQIKQDVKQKPAKCIFARRSWSAIYKKMQICSCCSGCNKQ